MKAGLSKAVKDDFNRLAAISTSDDSKKQSHTFGVSGFRRKKKDKNDVETTEYAAGLATAVSKATGGETITYLMGQRLMGFERSSDAATFWLICDALSTTRDVVNSSGAVVASYEFAEYGQRIASSESGISSQKTWVGGLSVQDEVADTGLMMMGHRFYDPSGPAGGTGRFLNRDPIGFSGGLNLFEYSGSRPISAVDPSGLAWYDIFDPGTAMEFWDQKADAAIGEWAAWYNPEAFVLRGISVAIGASPFGAAEAAGTAWGDQNTGGLYRAFTAVSLVASVLPFLKPLAAPSTMVAIDNNAAVRACEQGSTAFLAGRAPSIAPQVVREFTALQQSGARGSLLKLHWFVYRYGGKFSKTEDQIRAATLQVEAAFVGPSIRLKDALVGSSAIIDDLVLITGDRRLRRAMENLGYGVEALPPAP